jgi:hypothetical protein
MDHFKGAPAWVLIGVSGLVGIMIWTARRWTQTFVSHPLAHFPGPRLSALSNVRLVSTSNLCTLEMLIVLSYTAKLFLVLHGWQATIRYSQIARKIRLGYDDSDSVMKAPFLISRGRWKL